MGLLRAACYDRGMKYERKRIWFWQEGRYLRSGWTCQFSYSNDLIGYLIEAPLGWVCPIAIRIV